MKLSSLYFGKKLLWLPIAMILIISSMVPIITGVVTKTGTYFEVEPQTDIVYSVGSTFTINITIANAPPTYAWQATLSFNATVLNATGYYYVGNWFNTPLHYLGFIPPSSMGTGVSALSFGESFISAGSSASGSGWLFKVTFKVLNAGHTTLHLSATSLVSPSGVRTYYPSNDGFFTTPSPMVHDVAITLVTASSNTTVAPYYVNQSTPVTIHVTVLNEGNYTETNCIVTVIAWPEDTRYSNVTIGTQGPFTVINGTSVIKTFTWGTSAAAGVYYKIVSTATIPVDNNPSNNVYVGPEVHVVCPHNLAVSNVQVLTSEVDKSNGVAGANYTVVMGFINATGAKINWIAPGFKYNVTSMLQRVGYQMWAPLPGTWWSLAPFPYSVQFQVAWSDPTSHLFNVSEVVFDGVLVPGFGPIGQALLGAQQVGMVEVTVKNEGLFAEPGATVHVFADAPYEVLNFSTYTPLNPLNVLAPGNCCVVNAKGTTVPATAGSWWQIIASSDGSLVGKEFYVDANTSYVFHIAFVWPDYPEPLPRWVIAEREIVVGTLPVALGSWSYANSTATLYFDWNVTGNWNINPDFPAPCVGFTYTIKALVMPAASEEMKNWPDNKFVGGTINVVIYDVAVSVVQVLDLCNINGFYPVVRLSANVTNAGSEIMYVTVLFMALDALNYSAAGGKIGVPGDWPFVCGISLGVTVDVGSTTTVDTMAPYTGWNTELPGLQAPYPVPVEGRAYLIMALAYPAPGRDDNPLDDANFYGWNGTAATPWILPVINHDVGPFNGWQGTSSGVVSVTGISLTIPEVYYQCPVLVNVNVANYAWNPLVSGATSESVNVDLFYRNSSVTMTFKEWSGSAEVPITSIAPGQNYNVTSGVKPTTGWWYITGIAGFPPAKDEEFKIDTVSPAGYGFHVADVLVSGNHTTIMLSPAARNATAAIEVQVGSTQKVTGLANMGIITFFNTTGFPTQAGKVNMTNISVGNWYCYNLTLGGATWGNVYDLTTAAGWWELKFPAYDFMIHISTVQKVTVSGYYWYRFQIDKVVYVWTNTPKNITGFPLPAPLEMAFRIQPKTVTFSMCTGPHSPFNNPNAWYSVEMVAHFTLATAGETDNDPCNNKYVGYIAFKTRPVWGAIINASSVLFASVGKLDLIFSEVSPYPNPPYDVSNMATYYYLTSTVTGKPEYLMPDITGDGIVNLADVGKLDLIFSGISVSPPCP